MSGILRVLASDLQQGRLCCKQLCCGFPYSAQLICQKDLVKSFERPSSSRRIEALGQGQHLRNCPGNTHAPKRRNESKHSSMASLGLSIEAGGGVQTSLRVALAGFCISHCDCAHLILRAGRSTSRDSQ